MIFSGPGDVAGLRGILRITPHRQRRGERERSILRVRVETSKGVELVDFTAFAAEVTVVEAPSRDGSHALEKFPGTLWFYGRDSSGRPLDLAFLPDAHAGAVALPGAVESEPRGRGA
jgi:hypothetical protein